MRDSIDNRICTIVATQLGREGIQPDTPFIVGHNCSFRDLRAIAFAVSRGFGLPDFERTHWEIWLSVADVIVAAEKAIERSAVAINATRIRRGEAA